jgi:osmoprotectant transport system permease protein
MSLPAVGDAPNPWFSWTYVTDNVDKLIAAGEQHVALTLCAMALSIAIAVPMAILARMWRPLETPLLVTTGILYTIPSLAMIAALWPVFGLSALTVIIALALYALLIILRNILVGLEGVSPTAIDSAVGMGMSRRGILWKVEVPLAMPAILAGIRLATVSTVGLVTIGALVGFGGYGTLILNGFINNFYHAQIMTATLLTVALALIFDGVLQLVERLVTPWAHARGSR